MDQPADIERETVLGGYGWEIARYWNHDVRRDLDAVLADIDQRLKSRRPSRSDEP